MVNSMGVLGWGVGGIEAEAAMLGQPISMVIPEVVGVEVVGRLGEGVMATDLVLTITELLREKGVVGRFVEFFGAGLDDLPLADRATIANMAPEYGATCAFFPVDDQTLAYLRLTGRSERSVKLVEAYSKVQGLWRDASKAAPVFTEALALDMSAIRPSMAGPARPQDRVSLLDVGDVFEAYAQGRKGRSAIGAPVVAKSDGDVFLKDGDVVIAAITSCTITSNPGSMFAAGVLARKARAQGLTCKPWTKTSLAPGSQVVTDYLTKTGLQADLDAIGFNVVGYGCSTCCGNSGPLSREISKQIAENNLVSVAILSGNRNFEGRISSDVKANFLASPALVVAYAIKGTVVGDVINDPLGNGVNGPVFLRDIWPTNNEISQLVENGIDSKMFASRYADIYSGCKRWQEMAVGNSVEFEWEDSSTYISYPPYLDDLGSSAVDDIRNAKPLVILGDSITTDHISPVGSIRVDSPAGKYLEKMNVGRKDFNSYGARRGNHEVMMRATFANPRIRNEMILSIEGGMTCYQDEILSIYDAAMRHKSEGTPLVVIAGKEYGTGSSRDWAAKGTCLLGVRAVIAESFERIHRSNLIGMGILPLQFAEGTCRNSLRLRGGDNYTIEGIALLRPRQEMSVTREREDGTIDQIRTVCCIDTNQELEYYLGGGILGNVLKKMSLSE